MLPARTPSGDGNGSTAPGRRARRGDLGIYEPEPGEIVRLSREVGTKYTFLRYGEDNGGEYAVVIGGLHGHRLERCVTVDRVQPANRRRRKSVVRSTGTA